MEHLVLIKEEDLKYLLEMLITCAGDYMAAENIHRNTVHRIAKDCGFTLLRDEEESYFKPSNYTATKE